MKLHKELTLESWSKLPQKAQILNIGSELSRAISFENLKDREKVKECIERGLELLDLTMLDPRWGRKLRDLLRIREALGFFYITDTAPIILKTYLDWLMDFADKN